VSEQKKGKVKSSVVNHYDDGDSDTEIELEDGTKIVYSGDAPIPKGHDIIAFGLFASMARVMARLHPQLFGSNDIPKKTLRPERKPYSFMFSPSATVFETDEIHDETDGVTYKER